MLYKHLWLTYAEDIEFEFMQAKQEGRDLTQVEKDIQKILEMKKDDPLREQCAAAIMDKIQTLPLLKDYPYVEPDDLEEIKSQQPQLNISLPASNYDKDTMFDKVYGAWLGRSAGCLLGIPVECWYLDRLTGYLKDTDNYPIKQYFSIKVKASTAEKYSLQKERGRAWIENISYMPSDDDIRYTMICLKILEKYGHAFTPDDVAECWMSTFSVLECCTAERVAYKNFCNNIVPPHSATYRNPYREWIGAQIRADFYGYITPGNPSLAAEYAWRDAILSHVKNGIYGEMFIAAMLSAAAVSNEIEDCIKVGLSQIPAQSRLAERINEVLTWKSEGIPWEKTIKILHKEYDETSLHDLIHVIPNAMIVYIALLYGELDFEKSIGMSVMPGFDTDCNGATVGSIIGMILGAKALPDKWITPLNNLVDVSGIVGNSTCEISDLAKRTVTLIQNF